MATRLLLISVLMCPILSYASSAAMDGNDILKECSGGIDNPSETQQDTVRFIHCAGYVAGVMDTEALWDGLQHDSHVGFRSCLPKDGLGGEQSIRVILKWLKANPEKLHLRGDMLVLMALRDAFPCR